MKVIDNSKKIKAQLQKQIHKALVELGGTAEDLAKRTITENGNIDTGLLRANIAFEVNDNKQFTRMGVLGTSEKTPAGGIATEKKPLHYATYIEYGTSKMAASPFIAPAVDTVRGQAKEIVAKHIAKVGK